MLNPKAWLDTVRTVDRLLSLERNHRELIDQQGLEIQRLKDRLTRLEENVKAREEILIAEARGGGCRRFGGRRAACVGCVPPLGCPGRANP